MYAYFIDDWVNKKRFQKELDKLDLKLTQHGVVGRKIYLSRLQDLDKSIDECFRSGIRTFVAIGNDSTASKLLNSLCKIDPRALGFCSEENSDIDLISKHGVAFAVLPVGEPQKISSALGLGGAEASVLALSRHRTALIDLGLLNQRHYFLTAAAFFSKVSLSFPTYKISSLREGHNVTICNTDIFNERQRARNYQKFVANDGVLEAVITYQKENSFFEKLKASKNISNVVVDTVYSVRKIKVSSNNKTVKVIADTEKHLSAPVEVGVVPKALEVVVGENYIF